MSPLDFGALKEKKNQRSGTGWSPKPGDNEVRFLPPSSKYFTDLIGYIAIEFRSHFVSTPGQDTKVFRCLRDFDEKCPACAFYYDHRNSDDPGVKREASKFNPSRRFAFNILDLSDPSSGIQTYECGSTVHDEVLKYAANENWGDVLSPEEGRNFTVNLVPGENRGNSWNKYNVMVGPNPVSIVHHLPENWKEELDGILSGVPSRPDTDEIANLVATAKAEAGLAVETATTSAPTSQPEAAPAPEKAIGFSPEVSEKHVVESPAVVEGEEEEAVAQNSTGPAATPTSEAGPEIDPETGKPVCFGEFDKEQYPCDDCDVVRDCHMSALNL